MPLNGKFNPRNSERVFMTENRVTTLDCILELVYCDTLYFRISFKYKSSQRWW